METQALERVTTSNQPFKYLNWPQYDYYFKIGGFFKFWEGYDNEPICYIDDPVLPDIKLSKDDVQFMKTSMSVGPAQVEIKFGFMQFDSKLIISSNQTPQKIAFNCGADNKDDIPSPDRHVRQLQGHEG